MNVKMTLGNSKAIMGWEFICFSLEGNSKAQETWPKTRESETVAHTGNYAHHLPPHPELHSARRTAAILGHTPHLLLHLCDLALQPLDHAVQLADLHLDLLQAVSMLSSSYPELLILHGTRRRVIWSGRVNQAECHVCSCGRWGTNAILDWGHLGYYRHSFLGMMPNFH